MNYFSNVYIYFKYHNVNKYLIGELTILSHNNTHNTQSQAYHKIKMKNQRLEIDFFNHLAFIFVTYSPEEFCVIRFVSLHLLIYLFVIICIV